MPRSSSVIKDDQDTVAAAKKAARSTAKKVAETAQETAQAHVEAAKSTVADKAAGEAARLRVAAAQLTDGAPHAQAVDNIATQVQAVADHVRQTAPNELAADLATLVRRNPVVAASVAVAAGFALGRFAKATNRAAAVQPIGETPAQHVTMVDPQVAV